MSRQHAPSLREQLIQAIVDDGFKATYDAADEFFDRVLWPTLDKAIDAGELLVARNTTPQQPVHEAITGFLLDCVQVIEKLRPIEATISRRGLLKAIYHLQDNAKAALLDAQRVVRSPI